MATCDLCNGPADQNSKRYSCAQFRALVRTGLRPPASVFQMAAAFGMSEKESVAGWVQQVMSDSTDWVLCDGCAREAAKYAPAQATALPLTTNSIGMKLALIPAGEFLMGSPASDSMAAGDEKPQHRVRITKSFYLGLYPVTQAEYQRVMGKTPAHFQGDPNRPVEQVSWDDAQAFCQKLSALLEEKAAGRVYRLPTEAQWEYACRAGSTTRWCFGDNEDLLSEYAWVEKNSGNQTHPVGQKTPNAWGLHDMHGNVWEWCQDWYATYSQSAADDPLGASQGSRRVNRGGSWSSSSGVLCRSANRDYNRPESRSYILGFRVSQLSTE